MTYDYGDEDLPQIDKSPWIICPMCDGNGHHCKHLGSFTMSEFNETFDDPEDREAYFAGAYDKRCETCGGDGKIRESQLEDYYEEVRRLNMLESGRNEFGEPI